MKCTANKTWEPVERGNRALPGGPACKDSVSVDQCREDRGHCNQFTEAGQRMEVKCRGTCGKHCYC